LNNLFQSKKVPRLLGERKIKMEKEGEEGKFACLSSSLASFSILLFAPHESFANRKTSEFPLLRSALFCFPFVKSRSQSSLAIISLLTRINFLVREHNPEIETANEFNEITS
jgi:hypothetical protein